jgi:hypothetical protein
MQGVFLLSLLVLIELVICFLAFFSFFKTEFSAPDSFVFATICFLAFYSSLIQLFFLLHISEWFFLTDLLIAIFAFYYIYLNKIIILDSCNSFALFAKENKFVILALGASFFYLFLQALLIPPSSWDCIGYHLPRVIMMINEKSLFLENFSTYNQSTFPVSADILHFLFLRCSSDWFSGLFSFLNYLALVVGTYSLVYKVYTDDKLALVSAILIASLTNIVLQSTSQKNDIFLPLLAVGCFLSLDFLINKKKPIFLILIMLCLGYGLSVKTYFWGFALPFLLLSLAFYHKELFSLKWNITRKTLLLLIISIWVYACYIIFIFHIYLSYGNFFGPKDHIMVHINRHGFLGAAANALRYLVQMLAPPKQLGGALMEKAFYELFPWVNEKGWASLLYLQAEEEFPLTYEVLHLPQEYFSWYGPLSVVIILPALFYSLCRGDRFLKLNAITLFIFGFALCFKIGWMPWNNRFFSLFFGASGLCAAFFIQKFLKRELWKWLIIINLVLLFYAAMLNNDKNFFSKAKIGLFIHNNIIKLNIVEKRHIEIRPYTGYLIFKWFYYVYDRDAIYKNHYCDYRLEDFDRIIKPHSRLLVLAHENAWVLPFLLRRPDLKVTLSGPEHLNLHRKQITIYNQDEFSYIKQNFDYILFVNIEPPPFFSETQLKAGYGKIINDWGIEDGDTFYLYECAQ